jgi:hypothetical protein
MVGDILGEGRPRWEPAPAVETLADFGHEGTQ